MINKKQFDIVGLFFLKIICSWFCTKEIDFINIIYIFIKPQQQ
jgi:hypothetical protein